MLIDAFLDRCRPAPQQIVLDLDPFVDECHGAQQLVLFNGHYDCHCYLPLYLSERLQLRAAVEYAVTKRCERHFTEFEYAAQGLKRAERTIAKVEVTLGKLNPRFVVTDLAATDGCTTAKVYGFYCQRGEAPENRIKELKVDLAGGQGLPSSG